MNFGKKLFIKIVSLVLIIVLAFSFGGCTIDSLLEQVLGHTHEYTVKYDDNNHWKECSCGEVIDVFAHDWDQGKVTTQSTTTQKGEKLFTCPCGKTKTQELPLIVEASGQLSFHFMLLGNDNAGDCVYVKAGDNDILIDAGSRADSIDDIQSYVDQYVTDNKFEYVIATHAHQDHIDGFAKSEGSIFDLYECETIIDFPKTDSTSKTYERYVSERNAEIEKGAKHFTALECYNESKQGAQRFYNLSEDGSIKLEILYNYFYENKGDENDYSVCIMFHHGSRQFLFTGDLEKEGEEKLSEFYDFSQVELFKAGHHGSKTSSNDCLLNEIQPKICVVCCCAGSVEYTQEFDNTFPTQAFIDRISKHTDKVYLPIMIDLVFNEEKNKYQNAEKYVLMNGNIVVSSDGQTGVTVTCSNNNTILKDTDWFKNNRTCPTDWLN